MLSIRDLHVAYGGTRAVDGLDLDVAAGQTVLLIGANGAGKSSLINAVIGLVSSARGQITFEGRNISGLSSDARARLGIGYSPEGRRVFPSMSVKDNVLSGAATKSQREQSERWDQLVASFPFLAERQAQPAGQLSGGQQQLVAIARAMSGTPRLLLLDEPFLGLAPVWIQQISTAVRQMQEQGIAILMTEQMARPALKIAHYGHVMRSGQIRRSGTTDEIKGAALAEEYL
ncbi:ABC transporter ATP-binding protein [Paracoccus sulfuroxidans]|uniref:Branched-chain amino acid transport system ATP-binding protein n=1 Tax=Paracoccus sulfuroxidans TaxID=384678 RepID=A0A562NGR7_9RHOB|nr:ABC transporter ATP-binding protein [Paracoccus sulfuroxidans]TWI31294.1 branched-chain amino acid transport system ATP-binding protein [Paracoccus sulfuroxidans]